MTSTASPASSPAKSIGKRELIVLLAVLMSLNALSVDAMLPALDEMALELGAGAGNRRQLVIAVYTLAMGLGCLLPGSFADKYGRRPVMLVSLVAYSIFSLAPVFLHDFNALLVARGLGGLLSAGLMVAPAAIVRDQYEGDDMARIMSVIAAVFISVPVISPSLGQAVLMVAGWRWIFVALAALGAITFVWVYFRLPETLEEENRQSVELPIIVRNMGTALFNRAAIGYVLGTALLMGGVFGYVNSAQQLLNDHFGVGDAFPIIFGGTSVMMVAANLLNSRIVMRFGARRVSHAGVLMFIVISAAQVWASFYRSGDLMWFLPLTALNLGLLGFLGANFGSIAMQPFAKIAGAASSVQTFFRMFGAALVGVIIGQSFDGTARPFAISLFVCSTSALLLVLFSEKGRLFRRLNGPKSKPPAQSSASKS